jgi:mono/diheme cytochrome c family protein
MALQTPFGAIYTSNLTPDEKTGIGAWTADDFWQAMHEGRSRDGRLLYPAFPYPDYTLVTREDSDAIFAYLQSLAPAERPNRPHQLRFPYNTQSALRAWRALFFKPAVFTADETKSAEWNRGAYLVRGLGHCAACHSTRNVFGAIREEDLLAGGLSPMQNWYAPSLASPREAGVADWKTQDVVALLKTGVAPGASVMGPMASVVYASTQYLSDADLEGIAVFLKALPEQTAHSAKESASSDQAPNERGGKIYEEHCAQCHGDSGEGSPGRYPALAGNRAVVLADPTNVIRAVLDGGYLPATAGNPRPYGMPPFAHMLGDSDVAAVVSWIRDAWGNGASPVTNLQVLQYR